MESNSEIDKITEAGTVKVQRHPTNLPKISLLHLEYAGIGSANFYLDASDSRYLVLYTNDLAKKSDLLFRRLVQSTNNKFDRIWLPTETQEKIAYLSGNVFSGFGLEFDDLFSQETIDEQPIHELRMSVAGASSARALKALNVEKSLTRSLAYSKVRLFRGDRQNFVTNEVKYNGRIITKSGNSIDEHVSLIEKIRKIYRHLIENVERNTIGTRKVEGRTLVEGQAFDLVLDRKIEQLDYFVNSILGATKPFRLWGLKNKISKDLRQVIAVDLHTGDPIDMEITQSLIRIYLPKGACGNVLLRLYVNLQHTFDSAIRFSEESEFGAE
jgi:hypothetical protein